MSVPRCEGVTVSGTDAWAVLISWCREHTPRGDSKGRHKPVIEDAAPMTPAPKDSIQSPGHGEWGEGLWRDCLCWVAGHGFELGGVVSGLPETARVRLVTPQA